MQKMRFLTCLVAHLVLVLIAACHSHAQADIPAEHTELHDQAVSNQDSTPVVSENHIEAPGHGGQGEDADSHQKLAASRDSDIPDQPVVRSEHVDEYNKVIEDGGVLEGETNTAGVVDPSSERRDVDPSTAVVEPQVVKPVKVVMSAFGVPGTQEEEEERVMGELHSPARKQPEDGEEVWTEHPQEGTDHKRPSSRRFFSLMNLIKFLLNPVIEEFQEMEKANIQTGEATTTDSPPSPAPAGNSSEGGAAPAGNATEVLDKDDKKNGTESGRKTKFQCTGRNVTDNTTAEVQIVNSTRLLELLSFDKNHTSSDCVLVMFYAPWCHFCAATAPHYNAVARAFPHMEVLAVDTVHFSNLNARFGTVAVPNIMLFHQSRSAVRFNHTERHFNTLVQFITNTTGLEPNSTVELSEEDYQGPLSSTPTDEMDYLLWFSWVFIIVCSGYIFVSSQPGQRAIDRLNVLWQEHQHIE